MNYRTVTVRQASRRSWRIPQKLPVFVHHFVYRHTTQYPALLYIATKVHTANQFDGDLEGEGLDELAGDDALGSLAKMLFDAAPARKGLEQLFASLDEMKADSRSFLDGGFNAEEQTPLPAEMPRTAPGAAESLAPESDVDVLQLAFAPTGPSGGESILALLEEHERLRNEQRARGAARVARRIEAQLAAGQMSLL